MHKIEDIVDMLAVAQSIIHQEAVFQLRDRMSNISESEKKYHDHCQKEAWDDVKKFFCNNREKILKFKEKVTGSKAETIEVINKVVEEEVEHLLLDDLGNE